MCPQMDVDLNPLLQVPLGLLVCCSYAPKLPLGLSNAHPADGHGNSDPAMPLSMPPTLC